MPRQKQNWRKGDVFTVPLMDGTFALGQIVEQARDAMNSVVCMFSSVRVSGSNEPRPDVVLDRNNAISVLFVTRDLLDSGRWKVVENVSNEWASRLIEFESQRNKGFVGTKIIGSANVEALMNAFFELRPWGGFRDSGYLQELLLSAIPRSSK